jgi:hypothetical protein
MIQINKKLIKSIINNKSIFIFNKSGGVMVTLYLYLIIQALSNKNPITFSIGNEKSSNNLDKTNINSFFSLFFKNKMPKWLKYILILILCLINGYIFIKYINPYIQINLILF